MCRPDAAPIRIHYDCFFCFVFVLFLFIFLSLFFLFFCYLFVLFLFSCFLLACFPPSIFFPHLPGRCCGCSVWWSHPQDTARNDYTAPLLLRGRAHDSAVALVGVGGDAAEVETCEFGWIRRVKRGTGSPGKVARIMMKWRVFDLLDEEVGSFELGAIITLHEIDRFFLLFFFMYFRFFSQCQTGTMERLNLLQ